MALGFGFRVSDLGFRFSGFGFRLRVSRALANGTVQQMPMDCSRGVYILFCRSLYSLLMISVHFSDLQCSVDACIPF